MPTENRLERIKNVVNSRQRDIVLVLEDVHDPHNIEAILRNCDAFGVQNVYIIFDKQEEFNPRKVGGSSSSSANKWLDFKTFDTTEECIKDLKKDGFFIVATALVEDSEDIYGMDFLNKKIALVIGNEHSGVSKAILDNSDYIVEIPMHGMVQSFNVSVASAIFLYEAIRQRVNTNQDFTICEEKKSILIEDFVERARKKSKEERRQQGLGE